MRFYTVLQEREKNMGFIIDINFSLKILLFFYEFLEICLIGRRECI